VAKMRNVMKRNRLSHSKARRCQTAARNGKKIDITARQRLSLVSSTVTLLGFALLSGEGNAQSGYEYRQREQGDVYGQREPRRGGPDLYDRRERSDDEAGQRRPAGREEEDDATSSPATRDRGSRALGQLDGLVFQEVHAIVKAENCATPQGVSPSTYFCTVAYTPGASRDAQVIGGFFSTGFGTGFAESILTPMEFGLNGIKLSIARPQSPGPWMDRGFAYNVRFVLMLRPSTAPR